MLKKIKKNICAPNDFLKDILSLWKYPSFQGFNSVLRGKNRENIFTVDIHGVFTVHFIVSFNVFIYLYNQVNLSINSIFFLILNYFPSQSKHERTWYDLISTKKKLLNRNKFVCWGTKVTFDQNARKATTSLRFAFVHVLSC